MISDATFAGGAAGPAIGRADPADGRSTDDRRLSAARDSHHRRSAASPASWRRAIGSSSRSARATEAMSALDRPGRDASCAPAEVLDRRDAGVPLAALGTLGVGGAGALVRTRRDRRGCGRCAPVERRAGRSVVRARRRQQPGDRRRGFDGLVVADWRSRRRHPRAMARRRSITRGRGRAVGRRRCRRRRRGLAGVECLSGIPGTVGGTPIQNVGAYGQEVSSTIEHVTVYDRVGPRAAIAALRADCGFAYRTSRFKAEDAAGSSCAT